MDTVESYGLHWIENVAWLLQGRGGTNFIGLHQKCPIKTSGGACNHLVPTAAPVPDKIHWAEFLKIVSDPLVRVMLPIPREMGDRAFFIEDPHDDLSLYLSTLSRLSSPLRPIIKPAWTFKRSDLEKELSQSNIQPLVLTQATAKEQGLVDTLGKFSTYAPRTVIITGSEDVVVQQPMKRIKTEIRKANLNDLMTLPLENLGATVLRRFSRREEIDAPIESRDERRQRMIKERMKKQ